MLSLEKQLQKALELAYKYHGSVVDKGGNPYMLHPMYIALLDCSNDLRHKITRLLHDLVEDTEVTTDMLLGMGFETVIVDAVSLMTHIKKGRSEIKKEIMALNGISKNEVTEEMLILAREQEYFAYVRHIRDSGNIYAQEGKKADLRHNMDRGRIKELTPKDLRRVEKYKKAYAILSREVD